ncbi:hypothetical protein [Paenibacillus gansuensis]|uniref:Uncharacterized protein n=1 Tax=Paenibacillus gansuensis TaxID=306542 RepID=A0ABW5PKZ8_9BACL
MRNITLSFARLDGCDLRQPVLAVLISENAAIHIEADIVWLDSVAPTSDPNVYELILHTPVGGVESDKSLTDYAFELLTYFAGTSALEFCVSNIVSADRDFELRLVGDTDYEERY